ncbi:MAG TPA: PDZ domain-containing protein [Fimbriimonas sp.]
MSAASLAISAAIAVSGQSAPLTAREKAAWERIKPSIVVLMRSGSPTGAAAMIDPSGLFITHADSVQGNSMDARLLDGRTLRLQLKNSDGTTQLALLKIVGSVPEGLRPLGMPEGNERPGTPMFAIMPAGPVRAEFVSANQLGRVGPGLRILPLSEVRFERSGSSISGALLVSYDREFMGALYATLATRESDQMGANLLAPGGLGPNLTVKSPLVRQMGPAQMTVAYTVGPDVVRRVVEDFRAPGHDVSYPALGVFCRNAQEGGALIQRINPGSSAEKAGLRINDVILEINGAPIDNQIDFSRVMFRQQVGAKISVRFRRGQSEIVRSVVVGRQAE